MIKKEAEVPWGDMTFDKVDLFKEAVGNLAKRNFRGEDRLDPHFLIAKVRIFNEAGALDAAEATQMMEHIKQVSGLSKKRPQ